MFELGVEIDKFAKKPPPLSSSAPSCNAISIPSEYRYALFHNTAEEQYERKLLYSIVMMLMIEIILKSVPSFHRACLFHQEDI